MKVPHYCRVFYLLLLLLGACAQNPPEPVEPTPAPAQMSTLKGTVSLPHATSTSRQQLGIPEDADFVPLQVLVSFRTPDQDSFLAPNPVPTRLDTYLQSLADMPLQVERHVTDNTVLVALEPHLRLQHLGLQSVQTAEQATLELIRELRSRPDVEYAEPNYLFEMQSTPTDPRYRDQWHYPMIGLEQAWQVTTGSPNVVVAVLDTGILHRANHTGDTHPDFRCGRVLPSYDFVDNDADPYDQGPFDITTYHGTHVAGTIAACTNNTTGGAGVDRSARLVNVRVLGSDGRGSLDTIARAIQWAAGLSVTGAPRNPHPAQVINLSLGSRGFTSSTLQRAIDAANAAGSVIVVAAGNEGTDAQNFTPANASGVITVGAVNRQGDLATYSNYGTILAVVAPGGQYDGVAANGILSTAGDAQGRFVYEYYQGTSMAAPHVAGVIALMKAVNPSLTAQQIRSILMNTATPIRSSACSGGRCGAGLVDAYAAVNNAKNQTEPSHPEPVISITGGTDFGENLTSLTLSVRNTGTGSATLTLETSDPGLTISPAGFTLDANQSRSITASLDRAGRAPGSYAATLSANYNNRQQQITLAYQVAPPAEPTDPAEPTEPVDPTDPTDPAEPVIHDVVVTLHRLQENEDRVIDSTVTNEEAGYTFEFTSLSAGRYVVTAAAHSGCYHAQSSELVLKEGETMSLILNLQDACVP